MDKEYVFGIFVAMILGALAVILGVWVADARTGQLQNTRTCVVETAQAQGYGGNPYGKRAWELFAEDCP